MLTISQLPVAFDLEHLLKDLFVPELTVQKSNTHLTEHCKYVAFTYADGGEENAAILICETRLAILLGSSLSFTPLGAVQDQLDSEKISEEILNNATEIFNITSKLFRAGPSVRHFLKESVSSEDADEKLKSTIAGPFPKASFIVDIDSYGAGKMTYIGLTE